MCLLPKVVETAMPPAVNSPLHCINQSDRSIHTSQKKKSTRASPPCCRAIKRCMILSSLGISAACYIHRPCECVLCAPATCYLQLQPAEGGRAFSQRTDLSGEKKMGGVWGWLQISHWLTAPTGCCCWRQGPDTCMKSSHGARLHGGKSAAALSLFLPGRWHHHV